MEDKELRKLKRADLLEILIEQGKEIERLEKALEEAEKKLNDKRISIENFGTMAEAAFKLNHVYEAVDKAAKQYLDNIGIGSEKYEEIISEENVAINKNEEEKNE